MNPRIIAIHQPCYLPWLGYMHKVCFSDVFVLHDNVQYEKKSFIRRVLIRKAPGSTESEYLIVPLRKHSDFALIRDLRVDHSQPWHLKHLRRIQQVYSRAPRFKEYFPPIVSLLEASTGVDALTDLVEFGLRCFTDLLGSRTTIVRSSQLPVTGVKSEYNVNLVRHLGGNIYYSGTVAAGYQAEEDFTSHGIQLTYSCLYRYLEEHPYEQSQGSFINGLSMLDALFNIGVDGIRELFVRYEHCRHAELAQYSGVLLPSPTVDKGLS